MASEEEGSRRAEDGAAGVEDAFLRLMPFSDLSYLANMVPFWAEKHVFRWSRQKGISIF